MSRTARFALYLGTALCVVGLSKAHAVEYGYSWSGSSRFAWSVAYIGALCLSAYAFGLPELPRSYRSTASAAIAATALAAVKAPIPRNCPATIAPRRRRVSAKNAVSNTRSSMSVAAKTTAEVHRCEVKSMDADGA